MPQYITLLIRLGNVEWPTITNSTKIGATVYRYGGIVAYTVAANDSLYFETLPTDTIDMNVTLTKLSNSLYAQSIWEFKI